MARVLVAISEHEQGEDFMLALLPRGLEVYIVDRAESLRTIGQLRRPGLVIIDFDSPEYSGLEGLAKLRQEDWARSTRLVVFSHESGLDFVRETMQHGVVGYLHKPLSPDEIWERLEGIIASSEGGGQRREFVRVKPPPFETNKVELFTDGGMAGIGGELRDISLGGLAFKLYNPDRLAEISIGITYPRLTISFHNESPIELGFQTVMARGDLVAGKFNLIPDQAMRTLCRYIHHRLLDTQIYEDHGKNKKQGLMKLV